MKFICGKTQYSDSIRLYTLFNEHRRRFLKIFSSLDLKKLTTSSRRMFLNLSCRKENELNTIWSRKIKLKTDRSWHLAKIRVRAISKIEKVPSDVIDQRVSWPRSKVIYQRSKSVHTWLKSVSRMRCWVWIIFQTIVIRYQKVCHYLDQRSYLQSITVHPWPKSVSRP